MKKLLVIIYISFIFLNSCIQEPQLIIPVGWELSPVKIPQTCENSLIRYDNKIINLQGYDWYGDMWLGEFNETMQSYKVIQANWKIHKRLAYCAKFDGIYYVASFYNGDIYLDSFADIQNWTPLNNGLPIITHVPNTAYNFCFNPNFYIENDEFILYLEIGKEPDQADVRMAKIKYTWPELQEKSREDYIINKAGNSHMERKNGHTYMLVGYHNPDRIISVRLVIDDIMQPESVFVIKANGIHVGDASYIETETGSAIVFSYDQKESWVIISKNRLW